MMGFVSGFADTDGVAYCPCCGGDIYSYYADGSCDCGSCHKRFFVLENSWDIEDEEEE